MLHLTGFIRFARVSSHVTDFNIRNKILTAKLLKQGYWHNKLRKTFSKFCRRHYDLVSKFNTGLKSLLKQGLSEPEVYGDSVYKFRRIVGRNDLSDQFKKIIIPDPPAAKLLTVIVLTTKPAVCRITFMLYPILYIAAKLLTVIALTTKPAVCRITFMLYPIL